jgi:D-sedoheptulose 7-phosphate isomerase
MFFSERTRKPARSESLLGGIFRSPAGGVRMNSLPPSDGPARPAQAATASSAAVQARAAADLLAAIAADLELCAALDEAARTVADALQNGGALLTCGNGGSAADAQHLSEELVGRYKLDREPLRAICLNADAAALTCIANDYGFGEIFARQVQGLGRPGDVLVVFSTSGESPNILRALEEAQRGGLDSIAFLGKGGGRARALARLAAVVPSSETARVQEAHSLFLHILCQAVDDVFAPSSGALARNGEKAENKTRGAPASASRA